jgi:hypothetical protein
VGCVQGSHQGQEGLVNALGKAMHGLRPKALVLFAAQEAGHALGVREMFGAGNLIQVHRRKHLVHIPLAHDLTFDYDAFWEEMGGLPAFDGWFYLPRRSRRRTRDEIKPNKRGQYQKRYALEEAIAGQIRAAMAGAGLRVPPPGSLSTEQQAPRGWHPGEPGP